MATPIGHGLAGLGLFWLARKAAGAGMLPVLWLAIVFAILPDFDFLPGLLLGKPGIYHQGLSHSIGFGLAASLIGAWVARRWTDSTAAVFLLLLCCYSSHLLLDLFGADSRPPYGIPILWPLSSEHYLSPIALFPGVRHVQKSDDLIYEWLQGVFSWHNLQQVAIEILVVLAFAVALRWRKVIKRSRERPAPFYGASDRSFRAVTDSSGFHKGSSE